MTIGAVAKACGTTVRTLRYYEEVSLIGPVQRTTGRYRLYDGGAIRRIRAILALQDLHYSLDDILAMLGPFAVDATRSKREQVRTTRAALTRQRGALEQKRVALRAISQQVDQRLHTLTTVCQPCLDEQPEDPCRTACEHREVHLA